MKNVYFFGPHHPIFETLVKYPPNGYNVISDMKVSDYLGGYIKEYHDRYYLLVKKSADNFYGQFCLPRMIVPLKGYEADCFFTINIVPLTLKPNIIGVETLFHFTSRIDSAWKPLFAKVLLNSFRKCKKIVAISNASKMGIINYTRLLKPSMLTDVERKIEVVYPAVDTTYADRAKNFKNVSSRIRILHVNTRPLTRGLLEVLKAATVLGGKYDIELMLKLTPRFVTNDTLKALNKYLGKLKSLGIAVKLKIGNIKRDELFKNFYAQADIFVLPTWMDSFGFVYLEAMSMGLPCIGTDIYAVPEIIRDGFNGFIIHLPVKPYSNIQHLKYLTTSRSITMHLNSREKFSDKIALDLVNKLVKLIEDSKERSRMGKNSYILTHSGPFSIKSQQAKLKKIYEEVSND